MSKLASFLRIDNLSVDAVLGALKLIGYEIPINNELVASFITSIQASGKYSTLSDILSDTELMEEIMKIKGYLDDNKKDAHSKDAVLFSLDNPITCPKCGCITTLRQKMINQ